MVSNGRIAWLSFSIPTFAYRLAPALPMAFALHLYNPLQGRIRRTMWDGVFLAILLVLVAGAIANTTRSAMLGALCGFIVVIASPLLMPPAYRAIFWRKAALTVVLIAAGAGAFVTLQNVRAPEDRNSRGETAGG